MRIKLETLAPLPLLKAWFSPSAISTIDDLKISICADIEPLKHARLRPQDLVLLLDDFELLNASPIDVLRDGDLIVVKQSYSSQKRKAPSEGSPARKRTKIDRGKSVSKAPLRVQSKRPVSDTSSKSSSESSSESDSSSDSSSESDSGSSSDSESSSDSDSGSESSSSTSSSSVKGLARKISTKTAAKSAKPTSALPPVPPGLGKPSTHSRNIRRRRKKMYERLALTAEPATVNDIPLGTRARTQNSILLTPPPTSSAELASKLEPEPPAVSKTKGKQRAEGGLTAEPPLFMMASLQNKNKRRGFKDALTKGVPAKIVFSTDDVGGSGELSNGTANVDPDAPAVEVTLSAQETQGRTRNGRPRLVPPSEKQEMGLLPPNIFVTSVDVEEGMWPARRKSKKKKKAQVEEIWDEDDGFASGLPYDDEAAAALEKDTASSKGKGTGEDDTEFAAVEARWDTLRRITDQSQVSAGATVAWKALGINMATLTPEMLLHVARVQQCGDKLVVQPIAETGIVSFSGPVDEEDGSTEEGYEWTDVLGGDWRLVTTH